MIGNGWVTIAAFDEDGDITGPFIGIDKDSFVIDEWFRLDLLTTVI